MVRPGGEGDQAARLLWTQIEGSAAVGWPQDVDNSKTSEHGPDGQSTQINDAEMAHSRL